MYLGQTRGFETLLQVKLYICRVILEHDSVHEPLRKALSLPNAIKLHQASGAFLFLLDKLEAMAPAGAFEKMKESLFQQFRSGMMDADLQHVLENSVPANAELTSVTAFRHASVSSK